MRRKIPLLIILYNNNKQHKHRKEQLFNFISSQKYQLNITTIENCGKNTIRNSQRRLKTIQLEVHENFTQW